MKKTGKKTTVMDQTGTLTGIPLPVKVIGRVTRAPELHTQIIARRTVRKGDVVIGNVVEKVNLVLLQHQPRRD